MTSIRHFTIHPQNPSLNSPLLLRETPGDEEDEQDEDDGRNNEDVEDDGEDTDDGYSE